MTSKTVSNIIGLRAAGRGKFLRCAAGLAAAAGLALTASASQPIAGANPRNVDWRAPGGDVGKSHFSAVTDINRANVARLGLAWSYDMGTTRGQEATPVVIDGVMYTSGALGRVYALDARTGREIWTFEPEVDMQVNRYACCDQVNRGVAVADGKVFVGALDGMLYALDARTGQVVWKADTIVDHTRGYSSTGAPEVAGDVVVLGNAGGEYDTRGYVTAYRIADGKEAWRFYVTPRDPKLGAQETPDQELALKTWAADSRWDIGGGGPVWDAINYDPDFDTVYIGTGNAGPYPHSLRSPEGDNLYTSSLVALDRKTGRVKWFYQETPQDSWDYDADQPMVLSWMTIDGRRRPVLLHAPKNGFLYIFDRETGRLLNGHKIATVNWAKGIDPTTGKPILDLERVDYSHGPKIIFPSNTGARSWQPPAYDAARGIYYASVVDMGVMMMIPPGPRERRAKAMNAEASIIFGSQITDTLPSLPPPVRAQVEALPEMARVREKPWISELKAIDAATGKTVWAVPMQGWEDRGGVLATAGGLIFQGGVGGAFKVYDAASGKLLKSIDTGSSIMAAPMTYKVDGVQYVAVQAGWGGGGWSFTPAYAAANSRQNVNRILVFRLDGGPVPKPPARPALEPAPAPPAQAPGVTPALIARGQATFLENCAICHANQPRSMAPDLRRLSANSHANFEKIVLGGALVSLGMPRWDDLLTREDAQAIHAFLIDEQGKTRARELELKRQGKSLEAPSATVLSSF